MAFVRVNGALVDTRYLIPTIAWYVAVTILWPIMLVGLRRAIISYRVSQGKLVDTLVYWVHILLIVICLTIVAIDPASIYFGASGAINLVMLLEITILNYSQVIYAFVCSVQHYIVQSKLSSPPWIAKFKWHFVVFNFTVGNIFLVVILVVDRIWISGLLPVFCALEGMVVGPIFAVLVARLTMRLKAQFSRVESGESIPSANVKRVHEGIKKIRWHTFISVFLMFVFASIVFAVYVPRSFVDRSVVHSNTADFPDFARHRRFKTTFTFNWIMWVAYGISSFFLYSHWIKKSSYAGKLTSVRGQNGTYNSRSSYVEKMNGNGTAAAPTRSRDSVGDNSRGNTSATSRQYTGTASTNQSKHWDARGTPRTSDASSPNLVASPPYGARRMQQDMPRKSRSEAKARGSIARRQYTITAYESREDSRPSSQSGYPSTRQQSPSVQLTVQKQQPHSGAYNNNNPTPPRPHADFTPPFNAPPSPQQNQEVSPHSGHMQPASYNSGGQYGSSSPIATASNSFTAPSQPASPLSQSMGGQPTPLRQAFSSHQRARFSFNAEQV